jgi:hypothetical protein
MGFYTKIDTSNNRQSKQNIETFTQYSGGTIFGVPFSFLPTGPSSESGVTQTVNNINSTFTGTSATTVFNWYDSKMNIAISQLSAITPANSATTQNTGNVFTANTTTIIDGNTIVLTYSGVSFDITPMNFVQLAPNLYSGSVNTMSLEYLSAGTIGFTGRTIWVDVSGITRTDKLIISSVGAGPSIVDIGVDASGNVVNTASDISLKKNIQPISGALEKVMGLNGVYFEWADTKAGGNIRKIGFIAQDVENIVPELVYTHSDAIKTVHYKDVTALLVEAIKEINNGNISGRTYLETQTIIAEDNNIDLNFGGNKLSSIGGGIRVLNAFGEDTSADLILNDNGEWITNTYFKPLGIILPIFTPTSSNDINGVDGNITLDENYLYVKVQNKWKRINLETF